MKEFVTPAIVLARTNYGEADRIITLITPEHGKVRLVAKGVRRLRSKLAGGVELFSISSITYIQGRGDLGTLISSRLSTHFGHIVEDIDRTMVGYELLKEFNKVTEDQPEKDYFNLLEHTLAALDDNTIPLETLRFWFAAQLLRLSGRAPNLQTTAQGKPLQAETNYEFDFEHMTFAENASGTFNAAHIKFLRLGFGDYHPAVLARVQGGARMVADCQALLAHLANSA